MISSLAYLSPHAIGAAPPIVAKHNIAGEHGS